MMNFKVVEGHYEEKVEGKSVIIRVLDLSTCKTEEVDDSTTIPPIGTISVEDIINDIKNNNHSEIKEKDRIMMNAVRNLLLTPYKSFGLNKLNLPIIDILCRNKDMLMFRIFRSIFIRLYDGISMLAIPQDGEEDKNLIRVYKWKTVDCPEFNPEFVGLVSGIMNPISDSVYNSPSCAGFFMQYQYAQPTIAGGPFPSNPYMDNSMEHLKFSSRRSATMQTDKENEEPTQN